MPSLVVCNKNKFATVDIEEKHGILIIIVILFDSTKLSCLIRREKSIQGNVDILQEKFIGKAYP